jgi:DNA-binding CsgD family transcriptional regulator
MRQNGDTVTETTLINAFWDPDAGELRFEVSEAYNVLPPEEKIAAMKSVAVELARVRADLALDHLEPFKSLTAAEREVVGYSLQGLRTREISAITGQAITTIDTLRSRAMAKTKSRGMVQLALALVATGEPHEKADVETPGA